MTFLPASPPKLEGDVADFVDDEYRDASEVFEFSGSPCREVRHVIRLPARRPRAVPIKKGIRSCLPRPAAMLVCRLAWNHPLPDGNKRAAWAAMVLFIDLNHGAWEPEPPDIGEAEEAMLAIAAGGVD
jgi:hypothetical protein